MNKIELDYKKILEIVLIAVISYWLINHYQLVFNVFSYILNALMPFIIGCMIAFVLNVLMIRIEKPLSKIIINPKLKSVKRALSILGAILLVVGVVAVVITLIIPELSNAIKVIIKSLPEVYDSLESWANAHQASFPELENWLDSIDINNIANQLSSLVKNDIREMLGTTVDAIYMFFNSVVNFILGIVFAMYILMSKENLKAQSKRLLDAYLPKNIGQEIYDIARLSRTTFSNFIIGQTVEAFILGLLCAFGMMILRLPYAPMVGSLVGITAFIPIVGAFIGGIVGAFMIFTVDYMQAFIFVIFLIVLQQLEGDLIYPRVVGSTIGLPSIWVLFAITVGGTLWGVIGMLLSVPVASVIYTLIKTHVKKREQKLLKVPK